MLSYRRDGNENRHRKRDLELCCSSWGSVTNCLFQYPIGYRNRYGTGVTSPLPSIHRRTGSCWLRWWSFAPCRLLLGRTCRIFVGTDPVFVGTDPKKSLIKGLYLLILEFISVFGSGHPFSSSPSLCGQWLPKRSDVDLAFGGCPDNQLGVKQYLAWRKGWIPEPLQHCRYRRSCYLFAWLVNCRKRRG